MPRWMPFAGTGLAGMVLLAAPKKRRKTALLMMSLVVMAAMLVLAGCGRGGGGRLGPLNVTVTATSGSLTQSTSFSLIIQD